MEILKSIVACARSKFYLVLVSATLLVMSCERDTKNMDLSNGKGDRRSESAYLPPAYLPPTVESIMSSLLIDTIIHLPSDSGYLVSSKQINHPVLFALNPRFSQGDTLFYFINESSDGISYLLTYKSEGMRTLSEARGKKNLFRGDFITTQTFDRFEYGSFVINDKIIPPVFFEELAEAILLIKGHVIISLSPNLDIERVARCPGTRSSFNTELVISCLHAHAAAACGGRNAYRNNPPTIDRNGNGRMRYDCIGE